LDECRSSTLEDACLLLNCSMYKLLQHRLTYTCMLVLQLLTLKITSHRCKYLAFLVHRNAAAVFLHMCTRVRSLFVLQLCGISSKILKLGLQVEASSRIKLSLFFVFGTFFLLRNNGCHFIGTRRLNHFLRRLRPKKFLTLFGITNL